MGLKGQGSSPPFRAFASPRENRKWGTLIGRRSTRNICSAPKRGWVGQSLSIQKFHFELPLYDLKVAY